MSGSPGGVVFGLIFTGIGGISLHFIRKLQVKAQATLTWPKVEGAMVHSGISTGYHQDSKGHRRTTYKPEVTYAYIVNGVQYSGKAITVCPMSAGLGFAQNVVAKYQEFSKVTVSYNPVNPAEAVLEPGNIEGLRVLYIVAAAFGGFGIFCLIGSLMG